MSLESEQVMDQIRLRRRLVFWRIAAVFLFVCALMLAVGARMHPLAGQPHLARLKVNGIITDDSDRIALINRAARDPAVRGLILAIDSPGGSVAGGENLHDALARFAAAKPVVTVMGGVAASAGYMIAVPSARIFASNATLTGSIGVLLQSPDVSGLLGKLGVSVDELVSGPLKGQPSVVKPLSPEGRAMLQGIVMDLYDQFVTMVASGRHMTPDRVRALADGRPFTGRQALKLGLIDAIGTEADARAWLARNKGIGLDVGVADLHEPGEGPWWRPHFGSLLGGAADRVVASVIGNTLAKTLMSQGLVIDGAVALWQP